MSSDAQLTDPRLVELYRYWDRLRGPRFAPARADIDPIAIPTLLPHILLIDIIAPGRYRYRLVGTEVERNFGKAMTGGYIHELARGEYLTFLNDLYATLIRDREPVYSENSYNAQASGYDFASDLLRTSRLMLPLSSDGSTVDMCLAGQVFERRSAARTDTVFVTQDRFDVLRRPLADAAG
jgi:hypothetical protein